MRRLPLSLIAATALVVGSACSGLPPSPGPTVVPCWVGEIAEYRLTSESGAAASADDVSFASDVIDNRIIAYGLTEHRLETTAESTILVSLPRMLDSSDLRSLIGATGTLEFVPVPEGEGIEAGDPRPEGQALFGRQGIAQVEPSTNQAEQLAVDVWLTPAAAATFDDYAETHFGQQFAIVLDGTVLSAPSIQAREFGGRAQISGGFDAGAQSRLVTLLRYPPLPGKLEQVRLEAVSPRTGCL
jgi:preprotein translocase subunit SecD